MAPDCCQHCGGAGYNVDKPTLFITKCESKTTGLKSKKMMDNVNLMLNE